MIVYVQFCDFYAKNIYQSSAPHDRSLDPPLQRPPPVVGHLAVPKRLCQTNCLKYRLAKNWYFQADLVNAVTGIDRKKMPAFCSWESVVS